MRSPAAHTPAERKAGDAASGFGQAWLRFWFAPAEPRPLAVVRMLTGLLGLLLAASYAADLERWFGPDGMLPAAAVADWASRPTSSLFALATAPVFLWTLFGGLLLALTAVMVGLASQVACLVAAVLWASLLQRGPMLAGPADDCLAVLLWCLAVGPCGAHWSLDRLLADRRGLQPAGDSPWARVSLGLLRVHATAITVAVLLAQLKGDVWWDGTAAWWLADRPSQFLDLTGLFRRSEYLMNLTTHAIVLFELVFAAGIWAAATRRPLARLGLFAWPAVGLLVGEPYWGAAMAIFCVPDAVAEAAAAVEF
ncbi:MAG: hypothetical protein RLZZ440_194 [Planctomycetota bacterium]